MARTIEEIEAEIIAAKEADAELAVLTSTSKTAIWRLWIRLVATAHWIHEVLFDKHKEEVNAVAAKSAYGIDKWWLDRVLEYQHGHNIEIINYRPSYAVIDESARIVKRAAIQEVGQKVIIKAAKVSGGLPVPLSTQELEGLTQYCKKIRPAGVDVSVISLNADLLQFYFTVYYNALLGKSAVQDAVEAAIENHVANLAFNGILNLTKLIDDIQKVEGVVDVVINTAKASDNIIGYIDIVRIYRARSGYFKIDPAYPLSNFSYQASDV